MSNEKQVSEAPVNFGANLGYVLDLYDIYLNDPASVPEDLQVLFSTIKDGEANIATNTTNQSQSTKGDSTISETCFSLLILHPPQNSWNAYTTIIALNLFKLKCQ